MPMTKDEVLAAIAAANTLLATQRALAAAATADIATATQGVADAQADAATATAAIAVATAALAEAEGRESEQSAALATAQSAKATAEATIATTLTELEELRDLLDPFTPDDDWRRFGCRRTNDLDEWAARIGHEPVVVQTFSNDDPFTRGVVTGRPDRGHWLLQVTYPFGGNMVRGKTAKLADVRAQRDALRAVANGQRNAMLRRGLEEIAEVCEPAETTIRINNERLVNWFWFGSGVDPNQYISQLQANALRAEIADAHREADEQFLSIAADVFGSDYADITWDICVAGNFGDAWRQDLLEIEWPRDVPTGTRFNLGTDAYIRAQGDTNRLVRNLAAVDRKSLTLPNVVSKSVDEWGPHNDLTASAALLNSLKAEKEAFVAETVRWMKADHPVPVAWVALYETIRPNGRTDSTVLFADRDQRNANNPGKVVVLAGREDTFFIAANGERVPSNDPEMASAILRALQS